jgi:hypothetical protein
VQDSQGASATAIIRIKLSAAADAPSVVAERIVNAHEDQILRINPALLLRNDIDVDTDARIGSSALKITAVGSAEHGSVRIDTNGDIVFIPEANFNGEARFSYTVTDEHDLSATGYAVINIDPVNDIPIAVDEQIDSREDEILLIDPSLLLKNEFDVDIQRGESQHLSIISVDEAVGGKVGLADGKISFRPDADRVGTARFRYMVSDGAGGFAQATVNITLAAVNDAPHLPAQRASIMEDTELRFSEASLLAGATDVDSDPRTLTVTSIGNSQGVRCFCRVHR